MGTLGGGNHFIELCFDENDDVWIMLHSGSRGIGNYIGQYFIEKAKLEMGNQLGRLPDAELAYLSRGTAIFDDYLEAVEWAQDYAMENRKEMMRLILEVLKKKLPPFKVTKEAINCYHNYIFREFHFGEMVYVTVKAQFGLKLTSLELFQAVWQQGHLSSKVKETLNLSVPAHMVQAEL